MWPDHWMRKRIRRRGASVQTSVMASLISSSARTWSLKVDRQDLQWKADTSPRMDFNLVRFDARLSCFKWIPQNAKGILISLCAQDMVVVARPLVTENNFRCINWTMNIDFFILGGVHRSTHLRHKADS